MGTQNQKITRTVCDTIKITPELVKAWILPKCQRGLRVTPKVVELAKSIALDHGVVPGTVVLAEVQGDKSTYLLDGQQRREAFLLSNVNEGYVDVKIHKFEKHSEMGEEFVRLNSHLVAMTPDDVLHALYESVPSIKIIADSCKFVGFSHVRVDKHSPTILMSTVVACWAGTSFRRPRGDLGKEAAARSMSEADAKAVVRFLKIAFQAWSTDAQNGRLWGRLNFAVCLWIYRRMVLGESHETGRYTIITETAFCKCLMALSADRNYYDWLCGRTFKRIHRGPAFRRIKTIMGKRAHAELGKKISFPSPDWEME